MSRLVQSRRSEPPVTNKINARRIDLLFTTTVAVIAAFTTWLWIGSRLFLNVDEGIYLETARRLSQSEVLYRDVFAFTGPLTFWIVGLLYKTTGPSVSAARLLVTADLAILTAVVYWVSSRLSNYKIALITTFTFFAFTTGDAHRLYVNHRWDSSACVMAAVAFLYIGRQYTRPSFFLMAGVFSAAAIWYTPSMVFVPAALVFWLILRKQDGNALLIYLAGFALLTVAVIGTLWGQGAFLPYWESMVWTVHNYTPANRAYYGAMIGGNALIPSLAFFTDTTYARMVLPAWLPIITYSGLVWHSFSKGAARVLGRDIVLLLVLVSGALLISTYPHWTAAQLLFITPPFYILLTWLIYETLRPTARLITLSLIVLMGVAQCLSRTALTMDWRIETEAGAADGSLEDSVLLRTLKGHIRSGDSLFVFPYFPALYLLTGGVNPTRYVFLQPGMMSLQDEQTALSALIAAPPRWVIYQNYSPEVVLLAWPGSNRDHLRFDRIEKWIRGSYHTVEVIRHSAGPLLLMQNNAEQDGR